MAAGLFFCLAGRATDFFCGGAGDEGGTSCWGAKCHAADVVGGGAWCFALEPRVCIAAMKWLVLLLFGTGIGSTPAAGDVGCTGCGMCTP